MPRSPLLLTDAGIRAHLTAGDAVRWMGEAIDAEHCGDLEAPPRAQAELGDGRLVFTAGRLRGSWFGYRSYDSLPCEPGEQVVVVHDDRSGTVRAIAIGNELGPRRVGAIGGVAADALAPAHAKVAAIIGTGNQAAMQVWGLLAVRDLTEIRVYSRDPGRRARFAARSSSLWAWRGPRRSSLPAWPPPSGPPELSRIPTAPARRKLGIQLFFANWPTVRRVPGGGKP